MFGGRKDVAGTRFSGDSIYLNDMYAFDTTRREWSKIEYKQREQEAISNQSQCTGPSERRSHSAVVLGKKLLIFGGVQENIRKHFNDMYEFDTETSEWQRVRTRGLRPQPRRRHSCHVVNGQMFVFSGSGPATCGYNEDAFPNIMIRQSCDSNEYQVCCHFFFLYL